MKKIYSLAILLLICNTFRAADFTGIKIYINPGHGGYNGANDRNLVTINYELGDTLGFWESYSNLRKGLALRDMLQAANATVYMSRTLNREEDDRPLSEIAEEANANNVDAFLSIHSNALGTNTGTNYLLLLYHGYDNAPTVEQSLPMATAAWPRLISNQLTVWTHYTTSTNIRGDFSFYGNTSGLGVLRPLTVPGFLSEGSFHDYQPETHRLLNDDYRKLEATNFYRYFCDYFGASLPSKGVIAGFVKGKDETINHPRFVYKAGTHDRWLPLNGAGVKLMNTAGDSLDFYRVDTLYNGIFAFHNLNPGTYKLRLTAKDHTTKDTTVTVAPAVTTYAKMYLVNENIIVPKDTTPDYPEPVQEAGIAPLKNYRFTETSTAIPDWLSEAQIRKAIFRNDKLYVLTETPKIIIANATTFQKIREMDLTGISGGMITLSDIAFTSDGYLLACNKDTVSLPELKNRYFKVYTWDNDSVAPKLLFQTQSQANWANGIIGETFAVSGPRWKCKIYTTSVTSGTSKQIRIVGLQYEEGISAVGYKYMMSTTDYTEALWGTKPKFTVSPTGGDHIIIDSDKLKPREYQFDWGKPDRDPLVLKGTFAEKSGYNLENVASGSNFFRHAKRVFMASPVCNADSSQVGVALFDVTDGLQNAVKISAKMKETGLGETKATYMMAGAKVNGYDIDLLVLAQNQGIGRYRNQAPDPKANIYASALKVDNSDGNHKLKFTLNENASIVDINIIKDNTIVKVIPAGALGKGNHTINANFDDLQAGNYTWSVTTTAESIDRPLKLTDNANVLMQFNYPYGVAVDNNLDSPFFGRVYISEAAAGTLPGRSTQDGIYILDAALTDVTGQGSTPYSGGVAWVTNSNSSPFRLSVGEDGNVFICDWSDAHPGVWIMNPANPSAPFVPVFDGLTKASSGLSSYNGVNVHGSISHIYSTGKGADRRLYTFDEDYTNATATSTGNLLQYNIGTLQTPYQSAPIVVYNDAANGNLQQNFNSCIAPDGRGGWWISQYRSADAATIPSLIHVNTVGVVDFNSGLTPDLIGNSNRGGMAVNHDGTRLAMGCDNELKIFEVSFNASGIPALKRLHSIKPALGLYTTDVAFDRAGNVYAVSYSDKRLGVWALPKVENQFTTPAQADQILIITTGLSEPQSNQQFIKVYPNPANDLITIHSAGKELQQVQIFDLKGQMLLNQIPLQTEVSIQIHHLQPGVYILKAKTETGVESIRVIKK